MLIGKPAIGIVRSRKETVKLPTFWLPETTRVICVDDVCPVRSVARSRSATVPFNSSVGSSVPSNAFDTFVVPDAIGWKAGPSIILYSRVHESSALLFTEPVTLVSVVMDKPFAGVANVTVGGAGVVAGVTVNPFPRETTSVPVVTATVRWPTGAVFAIVTFAVRLIAFATVKLFTATPVPKVTSVVPWTKFVNWPVT